MRPSFSEFSFGFGVSYAIQRTLGSYAAAAPIFPSLIQEAQLGYDVRFNTVAKSLFLQFKRSDALIRSSAREWTAFGGPYYRFPLYRARESTQHNRLVALGMKEPYVYYCAPLFHTLTQFNRLYLSGDLLDNTAAIQTASLPLLVDNDQHSVVYDRSLRYQFRSTPAATGRGLTMKMAIESVVEAVGQVPETRVSGLDIGYLRRLLQLLRDIPAELHEEARDEGPSIEVNQDSTADLVRAIHQTARAWYGAEWFMIARVSQGQQQLPLSGRD